MRYLSHVIYITAFLAMAFWNYKLSDRIGSLSGERFREDARIGGRVVDIDGRLSKIEKDITDSNEKDEAAIASSGNSMLPSSYRPVVQPANNPSKALTINQKIALEGLKEMGLRATIQEEIYNAAQAEKLNPRIP